MTQNNIKHVGVLGMHWGQRRRQSAANAADRDAASLRKHGFTKEAAAVSKNAKQLRKKVSEQSMRTSINKVKDKKMSDVKKDKQWSKKKQWAVAIVAGIAMYKVTQFVAEGGLMRAMMKAARL